VKRRPTMALLALLAACGGAVEPDDTSRPELTDVHACNQDPAWVAWTTAEGWTQISRRTGPRSAEIRAAEGEPPLAMQHGDYAVRVLEDLTVCVDSGPESEGNDE
jgi:hypothetical protein